MVLVVLVLLGLCFGSFVNALTWRLHMQATSHEPRVKRKKKAQSSKLTIQYSILKGRSMCPQCKHELAVIDLIPVFSWLSLRGRCRYCHKKIDDNPLVELLLPLLFVLSYVYWPFTFQGRYLEMFVVWLILLVGFLALAVYDLRWMLLPNRLVYPLLALAVGQAIVLSTVFHGGLSGLVATTWSVLIDGGLFYLIFQLSDGRWIGGGDVKLGALLGVVVGGPTAALLLLFIASLAGTVVAVPLLLSGRATRTSRLPFGPFLLLGAFVTYLFGAALIAWYKRLFLLT